MQIDTHAWKNTLGVHIQCPQSHTLILYMLYSISCVAQNTFLYFIYFKVPDFEDFHIIFGKFWLWNIIFTCVKFIFCMSNFFYRKFPKSWHITFWSTFDFSIIESEYETLSSRRCSNWILKALKRSKIHSKIYFNLVKICFMLHAL